MDAFCRLDSAEQVVVAANMISHIGSSSYDLSIPDDFLSLALKAMQKVTSEGRSNVIYGLCKGLGTSRPNDPNETYFPSLRMPMGLLEYMVNFFITARGNVVCLSIVCLWMFVITIHIQLKCPSDYSEWLQSMYSQFGSKWCKLHRGPGWSYEATEQGARPTTKGLDPLSVSNILIYCTHSTFA